MCLSESNIAVLKTFSFRHKEYISSILREIIAYYGSNLVGLAAFGSYARGANRLNSDLDILIILKDAPGFSQRLGEFVEQVEMKYEELAQELYERDDILCELSPYILTRQEALKLQPIYYDLAEHHVVLYDPEGVLERIIDSTKRFLEQLRAERTNYGNTWEWSLGENFCPGGIDL